jgi:hypothetical protein
MIVVGAEAIAVTKGAVVHDDAAGPTARTRCEMALVAAYEVNDHRRHDPPPLTALHH